MRRLLPVSVALIVLAGCATPKPVPIAAPRPAPMVPLPAPMPVSADWRDWPLTPGDWRYAPAASGSVATFGAGMFGIACDRATRRVSLMPGLGGSAMTVRTTSATRAVPLQASGDPAARSVGVLSSNDPLLDAMAFSRGRFIVEQAGQAPLVIPAYAEIGRVIEDCRG